MSIQGGERCPHCGNDLHFIDKTPQLRDWGLVCPGLGDECGYHFGPGSAWGKTADEALEAFKAHCIMIGWGWDEKAQNYEGYSENDPLDTKT